MPIILLSATESPSARIKLIISIISRLSMVILISMEKKCAGCVEQKRPYWNDWGGVPINSYLEPRNNYFQTSEKILMNEMLFCRNL